MYISHFIISVVFTKRVNVLIFFVSRFRHFPNILPHEELPDPVHEDHTDQVEEDSSDLNDQVNLKKMYQLDMIGNKIESRVILLQVTYHVTNESSSGDQNTPAIGLILS